MEVEACERGQAQEVGGERVGDTTTIWLYTSGTPFPSQTVRIEKCPRLFGLAVRKKKMVVVLDSYHKWSDRRNACGARFVSLVVLNPTRL